MVPAVAFAQAADDPPAGPPSAPAPMPPPPPGYAPPPAYAPPPYVAVNVRSGMTFEANLGVGFIRVSDNSGASATSNAGLGGLDLGIGGFINDRLALTLRLAGVTYQPGDGISIVGGFLGPSVQYWVSDSAWIGAGAGLGVIGILQSSNDATIASQGGFGLDLRAGFALTASTRNSWNLSVEANPSFFSSGQVLAFAALLGYQYL